MTRDGDRTQGRADAVAPFCLATVSAKTPQALLERVAQLRSWLEQDGAAHELGDVCFTLNRGRSHFKHRAAVVVERREELIERLAGLEASLEARRSSRTARPLDEAQLQRRVEICLDGLAHAESDRELFRQRLQELAELYEGGATIDWARLYAGSSWLRVSLPTYPFARESYWKQQPARSEVPEAAPAVPAPRSAPRPSVAPSPGLSSKSVFGRTDPLVRDHQVSQVPILPGVVHLKLAWAAAAQRLEGRAFCLADVVWLQPVAVENEAAEVTVSLREEAGELQFELRTEQGRAEAPRVHSRGRVLLDEERAAAELPLEAIRARCGERMEGARIYEAMRQQGVTHGPSFQCLRTVWRGQREALGHLVLAGPPGQDSRDQGFHPVLADGALQTLAALLLDGQGRPTGALLPFSAGRVRVLRAFPRSAFVHVRELEPHRFQLVLADEQGQVCLRMDELELREKADTVKPLFFEPRWSRQPLEIPARPGTQPTGQRVVIIHPGRSEVLVEALRRAHPGDEVLEILLGEQLRQRGPGRWEIQAKAAQQGFETCLSKFTAIDRLYFLGLQPLGGDLGNPALLEQTQETGVFALLRLVKAMARGGLAAQPAQVSVITNNLYAVSASEETAPYSGSLHGLTMSLAREYPHWAFRYVDVELPADSRAGDALVTALQAEPANNLFEQVVALRQGERFVRKLVARPLAGSWAVPLRQRGVYLILGGLGGIGMELAHHLAQTVQARVVLVGRSPLPADKARRIAEMEALGAQVQYLQADAADADSLRAAIRAAKSRFGELHGVIHSAIVLQDQSVENMEDETLARVMSPKVAGSVNLYAALEGEPLDFLLFFSSTNGLAGNIGQGSYAAACAFKDGFARALRRRVPYLVRTINWGFWGTVGAVASDAYRKRLEKQGLLSIDIDEGIEAIRRVLAHDVEQVLVIKARDNVLQQIGVALQPRAVEAPRKAADVPASLFTRTVEGVEPYLRQTPKPEDPLRAPMFQAVERFGRQLLLSAFQRMGVFQRQGEVYTREELARRLEIVPRFHRLFDALLEVLQREGYLEVAGERVEVLPRVAGFDGAPAALEQEKQRLIQRFPQMEHYLHFLWACVIRYPDILPGKVAATDVVFPESSLALVENIYKNNAVADYNNHLVAEAVRKSVEAKLPSLKAGEKVRLIEIGAGTGGTSTFILEKLSAHASHLRYVYTDISKAFTIHGKRRFGPRYPFADFVQLDIEKPLEAQGFRPRDYDIAIAVNVLHATRSMRTTLDHVRFLLKREGVLILSEATSLLDMVTLTFGVLDGWWLFEDADDRIAHSPLLDLEQWARVLQGSGFSRMTALRRTEEQPQRAFHSVMVAECEGQAPAVELPQQEAAVPAPEATVHPPVQDRAQATQVPAEAAVGLVQERILSTLSEVLEVAPTGFDIDAAFTDFGVDSILAVEIVNRLNRSLGIVLRATDLFNFATIERLTAHIVSRFGQELEAQPEVARNDVKVAEAQVEARPAGSVERLVQERLVATLAQVLEVAARDFDTEAAFTDFGVDSILAVEIVNRLNRSLGIVLRATDLFNFATIERLTAHIVSRFGQTIAVPEAAAPTLEHVEPAAALSQTVEPAAAPSEPVQQTEVFPPERDAIAVIGMSGQFPESEDLSAYWKNLAAGVCSVKQVPASRWDTEHHPDPHVRTFRWGGFLESPDTFDPLFFNISPKEAELMDPQQRLFMQEAWKAFEDAGYTKQRLNESRCGVFVGCSGGDYDRVLRERGVAADAYAFIGNSYSILPARISYFLNLKGPSLTIDTACSSSLVAIHSACESLWAGNCEVALAGGVSVLNTPTFYQSAASASMLSPDGRCKAFDDGANGFVPGEGIGAVVLKPLSAALRDGDRIHGLIRGVASNQDGKTNGITAPSATSQTELECEVYSRFGIDPASIGYVEAHGTGTKLGDPIEVSALTDAFRRYTESRQFCALGSVKANIGHALAAAGIAGFLKALLCLKHQRIVPSPLFTRQNRHIDFESSPFYVSTQLKEWEAQPGQPRRAALSSFGFSGTNCHIVLEEAPGTGTAQRAPARPWYLLPLSAKTDEALERRLVELADWLERAPTPPPLADLAYTLQVRRTHFSSRAALLVQTHEELRHALRQSRESGQVPALLRAQASSARVGEGRGTEASLATLIQRLRGRAATDEALLRDSLEQLGEHFVSGADVDWDELNQGVRGALVDLPAYPFTRKRYWAPEGTLVAAPARAQSASLHPLIGRNTSDLRELRYSTDFSGSEFFIQDHVVEGTPIFPGTATLEMARAAGALLQSEPISTIRNVVWSAPLVVTGPVTVHVGLRPSESGLGFEIRSGGERGDTVHCRGTLMAGSAQARDFAPYDIEAGKARAESRISGDLLYQRYLARGLRYGPGFQVVREVWLSSGEALARLELPPALAAGQGAFTLHPALLDGALQIVAPVLAATHPEGVYLPFGVGAIHQFQPLPTGACYARAIQLPSQREEVLRFGITLLDEGGQVLIQLEELTLRSYASEKTRSVFYAPSWLPVPLDRTAAQALPATRGVLLFSEEQLIRDELSSQAEQGGSAPVTWVRPGAAFKALGERSYEINPLSQPDYEQLLQVVGSEELPPRHVIIMAPARKERLPEVRAELEGSLYTLFHLARAFIARKPKAPVRLVFAYQGTSGESPVFRRALSGFARTLRLEHAQLLCSTVELDPGLAPGEVASVLRGELLAPHEFELRYDRDGRRQCRRLVPTALPQGMPAVAPLRRGGVYLITGGLGGLGWIFAEHLARKYQARLLLAGRSALNLQVHERLEALEAHGAEALYVQANVTRLEEVEHLVQQGIQRFGALHGVLHCAGTLRDALIANKRWEELTPVLAPKLLGALHLDEVTRGLKLDLFLLFSSTSAITGNIGQADYAYANSFLDHFAEYRGQLVSEGRRHGRTLSINWPLWRDGGMRIDAEKEQLLRRVTGLELLETQEGLEIFERALGFRGAQLACFKADPARLNQFLEPGAEPAPVPEAPAPKAGQPEARQRLTRLVLESISAVLKVEPSDIEPSSELPEYGFDSISFTELANVINKRAGLDVTPALFFEYPTVNAIVDHLLAQYSERLSSVLVDAAPAAARPPQASEPLPAPPRPEIQAPAEPRDPPRRTPRDEVEEPLAIIGMSGTMPQSPDLDSFWRHLEQRDDLITEIPSDRWDWREIYGDAHADDNKTPVKWGGFIPEVDKFDPLFFGISPKEAGCMDPQQRLFLETVWKTIEDAGYRPSELAGTRTGIFVGVSTSDYIELYDKQALGIVPQTSTGMANSVVANRVSYLLGLHGPSEPVDTACSSALVAIHHAVEAIRSGSCDQAIAGGVNVILTPTLHISFSKAGMLSEDGRCRTFDKDASGYVRGEGVGAIWIKPLSKAEADGDHIYGLIRGSAVNHGGRANSLTAPNPNAQAELLFSAYSRAGIDPGTVGYIETHGTGTRLGDPVELNGLKKAFARLYEARGEEVPSEKRCALGSVKTNVGHLETAAGIAGVLKVLLALRHGKLPGNVHFHELNPFIRLEDSPFYVLDETRTWEPLKDRQGRVLPRRAGVSSFGFGGANAHLILEEYVAPRGSTPVELGANVVVLSAKDDERLMDQVRQLASFLESHSVEWTSLVYTLQLGREAMPSRLAIVASGLEELKEKLAQVAGGQLKVAGVHRGQVEGTGEGAELLVEGAEGAEFLRVVLEQRKFDKLARLWVQGTQIDWRLLYRGQRPRRIPLPTYPFARERHWIPEAPAGARSSEQVHPWLGRIEPSASLGQGLVFTRRLSKSEPVLRDHRVRGQATLPGVYTLVLAASAAAQLRLGSAYRITGVAWLQPLVVGPAGAELAFSVRREGDSLRFSVESTLGAGGTEHARGELHAGGAPGAEVSLDLAAIKARCPNSREREALYQAFERAGLSYGGSFQGVQRLWSNEREALGELTLPGGSGHPSAPAGLYPGLLDSALQVAAGITGRQSSALRVPFSVGEVELLRELPRHAFAHVESLGVDRFQVAITDADGRVCLWMRDVVSRAVRELLPSMFYAPAWSERPGLPRGRRAAGGAWAQSRGVLCLAPRHAAPLKDALKGCYAPELWREVLLGEASRQLAAGAWEVNVSDAAGLEQVVARLPEFDTLYFMGGMEGQDASSSYGAALEASQERGVISLFRLLKALSRHGYRQRPLAIKVITNGVHAVLPEERGLPFAGSLLGLLKSAAKEYPDWTFCGVDVEPQVAGLPPPALQALAASIVEEAGDRQGVEVAFRGTSCFQRSLYPVTLPADSRVPLRERGVYVILGGGGGIGLELAAHLARKVNARVALLGRSPLSEEQKQKISRSEALGGEVLYLQADATSASSLRAAIQKVRERFGPIHGVIHSAIVLRDRTLENMEEQLLREVLAPKVAGSVHLYSAVADEPLDFMLFFSSAQSFTGAAGQANYAAACTFKDAFARSLGRRCSYPVKTINWGYWGQVGIVSGADYSARLAAQGIDAILPHEGMEAIERVLASPLDQLLVMKAEERVLREIGVEPSQRRVAYPETTAPFLPALADRLRSLDPDNPAQRERLREAGTAQAVFSRLALLRQLRRMGAFLRGHVSQSKAQLQQELRIAPRYFRLFDAVLDIFSRAGWVAVDGDEVRTLPALEDAALSEQLRRLEELKADTARDFPELRAYVELLWACTERLRDIITGGVPATDVLFPDGSTALVEAVYRGNAIADRLNQLASESIAAYVEQCRRSRPSSEPVRILEIGAGTGGTSSQVLAALGRFGNGVRYVYSDVSQAFLRHGERHFGVLYPFMEFRLLNIERAPDAQGFEPGSFDLILAANVLHATRNIERTLEHVKQLLRRNGGLVLNETTVLSDMATLTFGLLEGWWLFEDEPRRIPHAPLLSAASWERQLKRQGFSEVLTLGPEGQILIAQSNGVVSLAEAAAQPPAEANTSVPAPSPRELREQAPRQAAVTSAAPSARTIEEFVESLALSHLSQALRIEPERIRAERAFSEYGVDSVVAIELTNKLGKVLDVSLKSTVFFDYPNLRELTHFLAEHHKNAVAAAMARQAGAQPPVPAPRAETPVEDASVRPPLAEPARVAVPQLIPGNRDIAIIGMSGRFADARNLEEFWANIAAARSSIVEVPPERWDAQALYDANPDNEHKTYCKWGGFLSGIDCFDAPLFNLSAKEAQLMDPQQRLFLEECWAALEDAGYFGKSLEGKSCSVFVGAVTGDYMELAKQAAEITPQAMLGNISSILAARISYLLNLKGPAVALDTACSSSLVAVHLACQGLLAGESELAIAGGVYLTLTPKFHIQGSNARMLSPEGKCKTFDNGADGFVPGEGAGVVVLKPFARAVEDGDHIYGVIKASGINQDGNTNGITAPSSRSQTELELSVYQRAGVDPSTVTLVEAHGTGTKLGDPVELEALTNAFSAYTDRKQFCAIGSVKTNIGHTVTAAGVASLIKVLLAMKHRQLPPTIYFSTPNEHIDFANSPFFVNTELRDWSVPAHLPRRAAVSSFGISGTNAHLVVEEYTGPVVNRVSDEAQHPVLVVLSARNEERLRAYATKLVEWMARTEREASRPQVQDIAYTLQVGRQPMRSRLAVVAKGWEDLRGKLEAFLRGEDREGLLAGRADASAAATRDASAQAEALLERRSVSELAPLWVSGASIDWTRLHAGMRRRRVSLPAYPFERRRYWIPEEFQAGPQAATEERARSVAVSPLAPTLASPEEGLLEGAAVSRVRPPEPRDVEAYAALEEFCPEFLLKVFQELGVFRASEELHQKELLEAELGISPGYRRLFDGLLEILSRAGFISVKGDRIHALPRVDESQGVGLQALEARKAALAARYPSIAPSLRLLWACRPHYRRILAGALPATDVLFPGGSFELVEGIYRGNSVTDHLNALLAEVSSRAVEQRLRSAAHEPVRILEVGAGTGGATAAVLARLASHAERVRYLYTDISKVFLHHGQERFAAKYPFVEFKTLDIERDLSRQGYTPGSIDLILGNNVVHATRRIGNTLANLRSLLKPQGLLVLSEETRRSDFLTLTFGLLDGWWLFEDAENRLPHAPLLSPERWKLVLEQSGFKHLGAQGPHQQVFVGRRDGSADTHVEGAAARAEAPAAPQAARAGAAQPSSKSRLRRQVEKVIRECLSSVLRDTEDRFELDASFAEFGVDSILAVNIVQKVNERLGIELRSTDLFNFSSIGVLCDHILSTFGAQLDLGPSQEPTAQPVAVPPAPATLLPAAQPVEHRERLAEPAGVPFDVAIVGMAGRFPEAPDVETFWRNLAAGRDSVREVPAMRWDVKNHPDPFVRRFKWGGFLESAEHFDPLFFSVSPKEALYMDPQQRLFLQESWRAFEDAGYSQQDLAGRKCGVFVGCSGGDYSQRVPASGQNASLLFTGNIPSILAARISYFLNLRGPSVAIDTACSSSLVALDAACRSLWTGDCEMALVGGVAVLSTSTFHMATGASGMLSADGRCKVFDDNADGFVPGEAAAAVVLKPLHAAERDGDHIYGVIKASGTNQDGKSNGITAPSATSQAALEREIYERSAIHPDSIQYVETHGTGTKLGDPIEVSALTDAFRKFTDRKHFCALGSVKSNIGHALTAAGIVSLIKVLLCLEHKKLVPSLHFKRGNQHIRFEGSPFYVNTELKDWETNGQPRRAAISSFGLSGTNAHLVLEEYRRARPVPALQEGEPQLIILSARNEERLREYAASLLGHLEGTLGGAATGSVLSGREALLRQLQQDAADILSVPLEAMDVEAPLEEQGLDLLHLSRLSERIQGRYQVNLGLPNIQRCPSLRAMAELLQELGGEQSSGARASAAPGRAAVALPRLDQIAYTLQVGRTAMEERLAFEAATLEELLEKLRLFTRGSERIERLWRGNSRGQSSGPYAALVEEGGEELIRGLARKRRLDQLAQLWCSGVTVDWKSLYAAGTPGRVSLPTYPFARQSFWLASEVPPPAPRPVESTASAPVAAAPVASPPPESVADYVEEQVIAAMVAALQVDPSELDENRSFEDYGVNSILSVDISNLLSNSLGVELRATELFNHATIRKLTDHICSTFADSIRVQPRKNGAHGAEAPVAQRSTAEPDGAPSDEAIRALFQRVEKGELSADSVYQYLEGLR
jgi:polyketide synthase PksM